MARKPKTQTAATAGGSGEGNQGGGSDAPRASATKAPRKTTARKRTSPAAVGAAGAGMQRGMELNAHYDARTRNVFLNVGQLPRTGAWSGGNQGARSGGDQGAQAGLGNMGGGTTTMTPARNKGGRPKGSKNKTSRATGQASQGQTGT